MTNTIKFWLTVIIAYILLNLLLMPISVDSTDKDFWHKSNLQLHIDNKTGCHYLSTWTGVIIPRLDKDGKHICIGYEE